MLISILALWFTLHPRAFPLREAYGYAQVGDVSQWQSLFSNQSAYALGLTAEKKPVFKDPTAALRHVETDCCTAISVIQKQYQFLPFSRFTVQEYGTYGWQIDSNDAEVLRQWHMLIAFYDIYENSF